MNLNIKIGNLGLRYKEVKEDNLLMGILITMKLEEQLELTIKIDG